jgi:hypothetical protein
MPTLSLPHRLHHLMGRAEALAEVAGLLDRDHTALLTLIEQLQAKAADPRQQIVDLLEGLRAQKQALVARLADLRDEALTETRLLRAELLLTEAERRGDEPAQG